MARFCTECGKEIAAGVAFCTECGTKAPDDAVPVAKQPQTQQISTSPVQMVNPSLATDSTNKVIGTGTYFGLMILFAIPIVGFIACIIMAFTPKNKNLKNYARAMLIWFIIAVVVFGLLFALFSILAGSIEGYINQTGDGQFGGFGDFFSQFSEFDDTMNEFGNMTEQFENGGLSSLPLE